MPHTAKLILIAGFIAGTLDALAAVFFFTPAITMENISKIFETIASGLFGKSAYSGNSFYPVAGLLLHYLIAFIWTVIYFFVYRFLPRNFILLKCIGIGIVIFIIMNYIVVPLSQAPVFHYLVKDAIFSILILSAAIGLPLSLIIRKPSTKKE